MTKPRLMYLLSAILASGFLFAGCSDEDDKGTTGGVPELKMVGAEECKACHPSDYDNWVNSGHRYKLNKVINNQPPSYPNSSVPSTPDGYSWSDITYVIGGYGWKARFMDSDGFIITGDAVQYNLGRTDMGADPLWSGYHPELDRKPYTCGKCHTSGWLTLAENGDVHQDGLEGIEGTWFEPGIICERCHGAGSQHAANPTTNNINIGRSGSLGKDLCSECHFRDINHGILAKGGFIRHHEQFDEMISAGHITRLCTDCHDPHKGSHYNADQGGIKVDCESCHATKTTNKHNSSADCVDCHMPRATKSGRAFHDYSGDVRSHIFKINTAPVTKDAMFFEDEGSTWSRGFITLDFACYGCHQDDNGVGGEFSKKTLDSLSSFAEDIHATF